MKTCIVLNLIFLVSVSTLAQEGYVPTIDGHKLHYRIVGTGPDTLIVPDGAWQFPYYEKNAKDFLCIVYDCRNRGYSDTNVPIGVMYDVEDLESVRTFFHIRKMNVVGWSYLGGVVALYASKYPERTRSVIQVGPIPLKNGEHFQQYLKSIGERRNPKLDHELEKLKNSGKEEGDPISFCRKYYEAMLYSILSDTSKARNLVSNVPCDCSNEYPQNIGKVLGSVFADLKDWDWSEQIRRVQANTLIIHGTQDNIPLASAEAWAALNKKARLLALSSSGHMPFAEEPELFFKSIRDFITKQR